MVEMESRQQKLVLCWSSPHSWDTLEISTGRRAGDPVRAAELELALQGGGTATVLGLAFGLLMLVGLSLGIALAVL